MNYICYCRTPEEHLLGLNLAFQFSPSWSLVMAADPIPVINSRDFPAKAADPPAVQYVLLMECIGQQKMSMNFKFVYSLCPNDYTVCTVQYNIPVHLEKTSYNTVYCMYSVDCTV